MNDCRQYEETLQRLLDDPETKVSDDLALHLDDCVNCRTLFDALRVPYDPDSFEILPPAARKRILQALANARSPSRRMMLALTATAVLAVIGLAAAFFGYNIIVRDQDRPIAANIVEDHIRYLTHPDRKSNEDPVRLKAYVDAYVDFPFELPEIPGTVLTGMRRCFLVSRRAALAFYDTPTGPASYFIVAGEGLQVPGTRCAGDERLFCAAIHGYRIVSWEEAGLLHAVVGSDETSLLSMARACVGETAPLSEEES